MQYVHVCKDYVQEESKTHQIYSYSNKQSVTANRVDDHACSFW